MIEQSLSLYSQLPLVQAPIAHTFQFPERKCGEAAGNAVRSSDYQRNPGQVLSPWPHLHPRARITSQSRECQTPSTYQQKLFLCDHSRFEPCRRHSSLRRCLRQGTGGGGNIPVREQYAVVQRVSRVRVGFTVTNSIGTIWFRLRSKIAVWIKRLFLCRTTSLK